MTTLHEAAQKALETMCWAARVMQINPDEAPGYFSNIEALRSALSQQQQQQPVAYLAWRDGKPCYAGEDVVCADPVWPVDADDDRTSMPVYAGAAPAAQKGDN